jgi:hypothetical protein
MNLYKKKNCSFILNEWLPFWKLKNDKAKNITHWDHEYIHVIYKCGPLRLQNIIRIERWKVIISWKSVYSWTGLFSIDIILPYLAWYPLFLTTFRAVVVIAVSRAHNKYYFHRFRERVFIAITRVRRTTSSRVWHIMDGLKN